MIEVKLQSGEYAFVECDADSHSHSLTKYKSHAVIKYKKTLTGDSDWSENIGDVNVKLLDFEIISTTKDITELEAEKIIEFVSGVNGIGYRDYEIKTMVNHKQTAKESIKSLIQSLGLDIDKNYLILLKK